MASIKHLFFTFIYLYSSLLITSSYAMEQKLHDALNKNDIQAVTAALNTSVSVNTCVKPFNNETPLMVAAQHNNPELIQLLLDRKAKVHGISPSWHSTPLTIAAAKDHGAVVKILMLAGASINRQQAKNATPAIRSLIATATQEKNNIERLLFSGIWNGNEKEVINALYAHASTEITDNQGDTPLIIVSALDSTPKNIAIARILLENNAHVESTTKTGFTSLMRAALNNNISIATLLLDYKANINAQSPLNYTPLIIAAHKGKSEMVDFLIKKKANVHAQTCSNETALFFAVKKGYNALVEKLIEAGALMDTLTASGETAYAIASPSMRQLMEAANLNRNTHNHFIRVYNDLIKGIHIENQEAVLKALQEGAYIDAIDEKGKTPLWYTIELGYKTITRLLLDYKASIDTPCSEDKTPLIVAIEQDSPDIVELLLDKRAPVNKTDQDGITPLISAVSTNRAPIVTLLLNAQADPHYQTPQGKTAFDLATPELLSLLQQQNAAKPTYVQEHLADQSHITNTYAVTTTEHVLFMEQTQESTESSPEVILHLAEESTHDNQLSNQPNNDQQDDEIDKYGDENQEPKPKYTIEEHYFQHIICPLKEHTCLEKPESPVEKSESPINEKEWCVISENDHNDGTGNH